MTIQVTSGLEASAHCPPQLDSTFCVFLGPGGKAQDLHRDDVDRLNWLPEAQGYHLGRDLGVTMLTALTKTTRENGATCVLPGSHLWSYDQPYPDPSDNRIVYAEMEPGDSLILLSSLIHAGGENTTTEDRAVTACFASRSHLKQLENQYLAYDLEQVRQFPRWLQRFMGYSLTQPYCGWVGKKDPLRVVGAEDGEFLDGWNIDVKDTRGK